MSSDFKTPYSQVVEAQPLSVEEAPDARYQALSGLAVASLIGGILSFLTMVSWMLAVIPTAAIVLGWLALRQIHRNSEETMGASVAWAGIGLAVLLSLAGVSWTTYQSYFAIPEGYELVSYPMLQPDENDPEQIVSKNAEMFDKRNVFVRGYISPTKQQTGLREFVLVDDRIDCTYCAPNPKPTQLIRVVLKNDMKIGYTTRRIGVGGEFTVQTDPKKIAERGGIVYQIDADCLR